MAKSSLLSAVSRQKLRAKTCATAGLARLCWSPSWGSSLSFVGLRAAPRQVGWRDLSSSNGAHTCLQLRQESRTALRGQAGASATPWCLGRAIPSVRGVCKKEPSQASYGVVGNSEDTSPQPRRGGDRVLGSGEAEPPKSSTTPTAEVYRSCAGCPMSLHDQGGVVFANYSVQSLSLHIIMHEVDSAILT